MTLINLALFILSGVALALQLWHPIYGHDYWAYLAQGRLVASLHAVPHVDVFSWTAYGHPWVCHEWLFELLLYGIYQWAGWNGAVIYEILWVWTALYFVQRRLRETDVPVLWQWAFVGVVFWASRYRWTLRADLPSFAFMALLVYTLATDQPLRKHPILIWFWPFLFCLWANMHGSFVLGLIVAGFLIVQYFWESRKERPLWLIWLGLCFVGTLVNPYGIHLHLATLHGLQSFQSTTLVEWTRTPWHPYEWFWGALGFFWIVLFATKNWKNPQLALHLFLSWAAISHRRNIVFFLIGSFPAAAEWLWQEWRIRRQENLLSRFPKSGAIGALLATALSIVWTVPTLSKTVAPLYAPVAACDFLQQENVTGPSYNDFQLGSYWMWRFGTARPLFIDSRLHQVDGYLELFDRINKSRNGTPDEWAQFLNQFGIESAMVQYFTAKSGIFTPNYFRRDSWALVYWDDEAMIFVRRDAKNAALIKRSEFQWVNPDEPVDEMLKRARRSMADGAAARRELKRNLLLHPQSRRTLRFWNSLDSASVVSFPSRKT